MDWTLLPTPVALAVVAVLGYLFGRGRLRRTRLDPNQMRRELKRARAVVAELERITQEVRRGLANHHSSVVQFNERLAVLGENPESTTTEVCHEADRLLKPTLELTSRMATAYDQLRQQSTMLMSFIEVRTDPLTGLSNRQAMDEAVTMLLAIRRRYGTPFSVAVFDIDQFQKVNKRLGREQGDRLLQQVAHLLESSVRETDVIARFAGEEFVVVLPETDLEGAAVLARRIQRLVQFELELAVSGGVASALDGDSEQTLVGRADKALYAAKDAGGNRVFRHTGLDVEPVSAVLNAQGEEDVPVAVTADDDEAAHTCGSNC